MNAYCLQYIFLCIVLDYYQLYSYGSKSRPTPMPVDPRFATATNPNYAKLIHQLPNLPPLFVFLVVTYMLINYQPH